jgi:hypothetical protein
MNYHKSTTYIKNRRRILLQADDYRLSLLVIRRGRRGRGADYRLSVVAIVLLTPQRRRRSARPA